MAVRNPLVVVAGQLREMPAGDTFSKAAVGLGSVDDTADASKPISTAQQTALNAKAPLTGGGTSGSWPISVTGNAGTATTAATPLFSAYLSSHSTADADAAGAIGGGFQVNYSGPSTVGKPSGTDHSLVTLAYGAGASSWRSQFAHDWRTNSLSVRGMNAGVWSAWKTVAYTDSNITGSAASVPWTGVTGKPAFIAAGADAAAARLAIGAGTSSLALGVTSATAKAGNYAPAWTDVTSKPAVIAAGVDAAAARLVIGAGTGSGTVTSVGGTGAVSGLTLTGTVSGSGSLTLGGALAVLPSNFASQTASMALLAPSAANGVPTFRYVELSDIVDAWTIKSVRAATTANITLSAPQTIDGIALVAGDRVLVKNQTTASQNGVYLVAAGTWTRALDANASARIAGGTVNIDSGTQGGTLYTTTFKATDVIGTTAMNWFRVVDTGMAGAVVGTAPGTAAVGVSPNYARQDHVHPAQTTATIEGLEAWQASPTGVQGINGGSISGMRNVLINGDMRISQRGQTFANPPSIYTLDRWIIAADNAAGLSYSVEATAAAQDKLDYSALAGATRLLRCNVSTKGLSTYIDVKQPIEGVGTLQGKQITVSLLHRFSTTAKNISVHYIQNFGGGGSTTISGQLGVSQLGSNSVEFVAISFTGVIPSIAGKTIGPNSSITIVIRVATPENSEFFDITDVQAELGSVPSVFERRPYGLELMLCRRYYLQSEALSGYNSTSVLFHVRDLANGSPPWAFWAGLPISTPMRVTPTVVFYSFAGTTGQVSSGAVGAPDRAITSATFYGGGLLSCSINSGADTCYANFTASAEL